jgi:hypothetical protein
MSRAGLEDILYQDASFGPTDSAVGSPTTESPVNEQDGFFGGAAGLVRSARERSTPRKSLIVVLPENHVVSPELVTERLPAVGDHEKVDVIVACAGQPFSLAGLQRRVRDLQVLLAPAGTSTEDLRELAMKRAPGDIVTLLSGAPYCSLGRASESPAGSSKTTA